jgi:serine/threonine-protein kinase SRPK1
MKPENVLISVDEVHVRHLAQEAAEWQRLGITPKSGSAIASLCLSTPAENETSNEHITGETNIKSALCNSKLSKNQKKKFKKKKKRIETLLDTQQKQIELLEKQNLNLLGYDCNLIESKITLF